MVDMRKAVMVLLVVTSSVAAGASAASTDPGAARAAATGGISIRIPEGWHVLRGWLSYVTDPVPRLAVASFPVRLSRRTCECGMPNVENLPRNGAFLFVWEYRRFSKRTLKYFPLRPAQFRMGTGQPQRYTCQGPSYEFSFREAGRAFQADVYLGSLVRPKLRAGLLALLDNLRVAADPAGARRQR
jgi:hypothetical protein